MNIEEKGRGIKNIDPIHINSVLSFSETLGVATIDLQPIGTKHTMRISYLIAKQTFNRFFIYCPRQ